MRAVRLVSYRWEVRSLAGRKAYGDITMGLLPFQGNINNSSTTLEDKDLYKRNDILSTGQR